MKKIKKDILLNIAGLLGLIIPVILAYNIEVIFPPLLITWTVPFYLVIMNILMSKQYNNIFSFWRVIHCSLILLLGYVFSYNYISFYFILNDSIIDQWTKILLFYEFIISLVIVVVGLFLYQFVSLLILLINNKRKTKINTKENPSTPYSDATCNLHSKCGAYNTEEKLRRIK